MPATIPFEDPRKVDRLHLYSTRQSIFAHRKKLPLQPFILFVDVSVSRGDDNIDDTGSSNAETSGHSDFPGTRMPEVTQCSPSASRMAADLEVDSTFLGREGNPQPPSGRDKVNDAVNFDTILGRERSLSPVGATNSDATMEVDDPISRSGDRRIINPDDAPFQDIFMPLDGMFFSQFLYLFIHSS